MLDSLPTRQKRTTIDPEEDLLTAGTIDSVSLMELVTALESEFGVELEDDDLVMDNFRSVESIENLVELKRAAA